MLNNTRYLHILLDSFAVDSFKELNFHLLKRKYPGEHVALVRDCDKEQTLESHSFDEVFSIDVDFIQKASFSPLLGDATAFRYFWSKLHPLSEKKWARVFNLSSSPMSASCASLFPDSQLLGSYSHSNQVMCHESPLKLTALLRAWGLEHPFITSLLQRRSLQQLDWQEVDDCMQQITQFKSKKSGNPLKSVLLGIDKRSFTAEDVREAQEANEMFQIVSLNPDTSSWLQSMTIPFMEWSDKSKNSFLLDIIWSETHPIGAFWEIYFGHMENDSSDNVRKMEQALMRDLTKWVCLAFLFDYLGQQRLSLMAEKLISRYGREHIKNFLYFQVMELKNFTKILLDALRVQGHSSQDNILNYWKTRSGPISFLCAIELSLHPSLVPVIRHDQDLLAVKHRMRQLNAFFERIYKAVTLEIPKTDLSLTL